MWSGAVANQLKAMLMVISVTAPITAHFSGWYGSID